MSLNRDSTVAVPIKNWNDFQKAIVAGNVDLVRRIVHGQKLSALDFDALLECKDKTNAIAIVGLLLQQNPADNAVYSLYHSAALAEVAHRPVMAEYYVAHVPSCQFTDFLPSRKYQPWLNQMLAAAVSADSLNYPLISAIVGKELVINKKFLKLPPAADKIVLLALDNADLKLLLWLNGQQPDIVSSVMRRNLQRITQFVNKHKTRKDFKAIFALLPVTDALFSAAAEEKPCQNEIVEFQKATLGGVGHRSQWSRVTKYVEYVIDVLEQKGGLDPVLAERKSTTKSPYSLKKKDDVAGELEVLEVYRQVISGKISAKDKGYMLLDLVQKDQRYRLLMVDALLASGEIDLHTKDRDKKTALVHAVHTGRIPEFYTIFSAQKLKGSIVSEEIDQALQVAIDCRNDPIIRELAPHCSKKQLKALVAPGALLTGEGAFEPTKGLKFLFTTFLNTKDSSAYIAMLEAACMGGNSALVRFYLEQAVSHPSAPFLLFALEVQKSMQHILDVYSDRLDYATKKYITECNFLLDYPPLPMFYFLEKDAVERNDIKLLFTIANRFNSNVARKEAGKYINVPISETLSDRHVKHLLKVPIEHLPDIQGVIDFFKVAGNHERMYAFYLPWGPLIVQAALQTSKILSELLCVVLNLIWSNENRDVLYRDLSGHIRKWLNLSNTAIKDHLQRNPGMSQSDPCLAFLRSYVDYQYPCGQFGFLDHTLASRELLGFCQKYLDATQELGIAQTTSIEPNLAQQLDKVKGQAAQPAVSPHRQNSVFALPEVKEVEPTGGHAVTEDEYHNLFTF